ncbi:MAG: alpha-glucan family phosphorylase [Candidatus Eremiobacteraeota bacterium]|nr:alpha-glucan family phosphorylase [Candidatus Eremiobacteraeota bacterium]MBV9408013.1 alpha-glucan family phosphorylase [Candidatus Eremiobacteraeota bacterium]
MTADTRTMTDPLVAYISMEIAVSPAVATYSGGLGVLAGDVVRAAADAAYPMVGVTLLYHDGYFRQRLDAAGAQHEEPQDWRPADALEQLPQVVTIPISGRPVHATVWRYTIVGVDGAKVPVYFLDSDRADNDEAARHLTTSLYGGDARYRLEQEALLGLGTVELLRTLGYNRIGTYHMNEGHSALLVLALLDQVRTSPHGAPTGDDLARVRERCVFTTHTPVPAGHDCFGLDLATEVLGTERVATLRALDLADHDVLNMTHLALRASRFTNAVAMKHGEVSRAMFPDAEIHAITNGVHSGTWTSKPFQALFDERLPGWRRDNWQLRQAIGIPLHEIGEAHAAAKQTLIDRVAHTTGKLLDPKRFTIGIARRATAYKRNDLILRDPERLAAIAKKFGGIQLVFGGKAHPRDWDGKAMIKHIVGSAPALAGTVDIVYVENYDMTWGAALTAGADVWLNTPRPPNEASGTSGMKAALNGVPSLSVMDGWWIEGAIDGVTGWSVDAETGNDDARTADALYSLLEHTILPSYTQDRYRYLATMRATIAFNGSHFNAQRMLAQYALEAYTTTESTERAERLAG